MRVLTSDLATGGCTVWNITDELRLEKEREFGNKGRQLYIQKLCAFKWHEKEYILAGRKGLTLDIYDVQDDFRCIKTKHLMTTQAESDFFVSLEVLESDQFRVCTGLGYCYFLSLDTLLTSCYNDFSMSFGLHGSVSFFKFLPQTGPRTSSSTSQNRQGGSQQQQHKRVIVGGKDREIAIIEIDTHTNVWKSKSIKKVDKVLEGYVNREPVWIQDVVIIPPLIAHENENENDDDDEHNTNNDNGDEYSRIIAATRFGKLLLYDPNVTKYPIDELQVCEHPIKHIKPIGAHLLLVADAFNNVLILDHMTMTVVNRLRIPLGPLSSLITFPLESLDRRCSSKSMAFASSSVDKTLRIYMYEDGYATCIDTMKVDTTISEMILLDEQVIPPILEQWLDDNERSKRSRI